MLGFIQFLFCDTYSTLRSYPLHRGDKYFWLGISPQFLSALQNVSSQIFIWEELKAGSRTYYLQKEPGMNIFSFCLVFILI